MIEPAKAVFLDRDGTLLKYVHYLHKPEDTEVLPGVPAALRRALAHGARLFLLTNQSGVGQGLFSLADVEAVNQRMLELLGLGHDVFTQMCIATEHPAAEPVYRKPSPRFILETLSQYGIPRRAAVIVGDNPSDWQAGINAGIRSVAVRSPLFDQAAERLRQNAGIVLYDGLGDWATTEWPP